MTEQSPANRGRNRTQFFLDGAKLSHVEPPLRRHEREHEHRCAKEETCLYSHETPQRVRTGRF